jgi:hypothetical protein
MKNKRKSNSRKSGSRRSRSGKSKSNQSSAYHINVKTSDQYSLKGSQFSKNSVFDSLRNIQNKAKKNTQDTQKEISEVKFVFSNRNVANANKANQEEITSELPSEMQRILQMDKKKFQEEEEEIQDFKKSVPRPSQRENTIQEDINDLNQEENSNQRQPPKPHQVSKEELKRRSTISFDSIGSSKRNSRKGSKHSSKISRKSNFSSRRTFDSRNKKSVKNSNKDIKNNFSSQKMSVDVDNEVHESNNFEGLNPPPENDLINISQQIEELRLSESFKKSQKKLETQSKKSIKTSNVSKNSKSSQSEKNIIRSSKGPQDISESNKEISSKMIKKSSEEVAVIEGQDNTIPSKPESNKRESKRSIKSQSRRSNYSRKSRKSNYSRKSQKSNYSKKNSIRSSKFSEKNNSNIPNSNTGSKRSTGFAKNAGKKDSQKQSIKAGYPEDSKSISDVLGNKEVVPVKIESEKNVNNQEEEKTNENPKEIDAPENLQINEPITVASGIKTEHEISRTPQASNIGDKQANPEESNKKEVVIVEDKNSKEEVSPKDENKKKKRGRSEKLKNLNKKMNRAEKSQNLKKKYDKFNPRLPLNSYKRKLEKKGKKIPEKVSKSLIKLKRKKTPTKRKTDPNSKSKTKLRTDKSPEKDKFYDNLFETNKLNAEEVDEEKLKQQKKKISKKIKNNVNRLYTVKNNSRVVLENLPVLKSGKKPLTPKKMKTPRTPKSRRTPRTPKSMKNRSVSHNKTSNRVLWKNPRYEKEIQSRVKDFIETEDGIQKYQKNKDSKIDERLRKLEADKKKINKIKFEMNQLKFLIEREDKMKKIRNAGTEKKDMEDRWILRKKLKEFKKEKMKIEKEFLKKMREDNWDELRKYKKEKNEGEIKQNKDKIEYVIMSI